MKHVSCTLLDHRYMSRGLAMIRSLRRVVPEAQIWVLCLDDCALEIFRQIREPGVRALALAEFEAGDPELVMAKADGRSVIEYYFSAKPSLISGQGQHHPAPPEVRTSREVFPRQSHLCIEYRIR